MDNTLYNGKHLCVFGCLMTNLGMNIKSEMLKWLESEYHVFCVPQDPPGTLFEYPAIYYTCRMAIDLNKPVLYIHTKGAAHHAKVQSYVRRMWQNEFTYPKAADYFNTVNTDCPTVACPITSSDRITWLNSWVINPAAAKLLINKLHICSNRLYFEGLFRDNGDPDRELKSNVVGIVHSGVNSPSDVWKLVKEYMRLHNYAMEEN